MLPENIFDLSYEQLSLHFTFSKFSKKLSISKQYNKMNWYLHVGYRSRISSGILRMNYVNLITTYKCLRLGSVEKLRLANMDKSKYEKKSMFRMQRVKVFLGGREGNTVDARR